jgi:uncharacterized membrane protein
MASGVGVGRSVIWGIWTVLCIGVALVSYRYVAGIGPFPPEIISNYFAPALLALHAGSASTALLVGPFQFIARIRAAYPLVHRTMGRIYVLSSLVGGVTGLILAFGATTGPISTAGFGLLAIALLVTTGMAWRLAVRREIPAHRRWMIRSFALICAAVTLRIYLPMLFALPVSFDDGYRAISFLCWVPNLIVAELIIRRRHSAKPVAAA